MSLERLSQRLSSPLPAPQVAPAPELARPQAQPQLTPLARPMALSAPTVECQAAALTVSYLEMAEQNAALIEAGVKALGGVLAAKGLDPAKVSMVLNLDVTGHEVQVCLACGVVGHDYKPTMTRLENPEINMLAEELVVFQEVASRVGIAYGVVAYDEEVLPLRAVGPPDAGTSARADLVQRFNAFKDRHEIKGVQDGVILAWMKEEIAKWNPADATKKVVGEPADRRALESSQRVFGDAEGMALKGIVCVKGQPGTSLRALEALANTKRFQLYGVAVGKEADEVAKTMVKRTSKAYDMHDLRRETLKGLVDLAERAPERAT